MQKRGIEIVATSEDVPQRQSSADSHLAISKPIEFQVLGPTEARRAGQQIPLSGARRGALLTRLLLDAGRAVSAETLIEDVWDGHAPSAASATLQSHVSQLRKVLGDRLRRSAAGYLLRLDAATVDAAEFEGGLANGATHMAEGDVHEAAGSLREALLLWRGRALQDVADRPWARPEAERLEELRRIAVEQLLQARLEPGEHQQVVPDAEAAVEENPLREQRWAILMLALYRSGRQADALRAYRRLRKPPCRRTRDRPVTTLDRPRGRRPPPRPRPATPCRARAWRDDEA